MQSTNLTCFTDHRSQPSVSVYEKFYQSVQKSQEFYGSLFFTCDRVRGGRDFLATISAAGFAVVSSLVLLATSCLPLAMLLLLLKTFDVPCAVVDLPTILASPFLAWDFVSANAWKS